MTPVEDYNEVVGESLETERTCSISLKQSKREKRQSKMVLVAAVTRASASAMMIVFLADRVQIAGGLSSLSKFTGGTRLGSLGGEKMCRSSGLWSSARLPLERRQSLPRFRATNGDVYASITDCPNSTVVANTTPSESVSGVTVLRPGDPLEFWHAKSVGLGFYEGPVPGRRSLSVRTSDGETLVVDIGQVVNVWKSKDMRGPLPRLDKDWATLSDGVRHLLQNTPTQGLDLGEFWKAAIAHGKGLVVKSNHAAEFLFSEDMGKRGLKKRPLFKFNSSSAFKPNVMERAAAAQLLSTETNRFKRVISEIPKEMGTGVEAGRGKGGSVSLKIGGFKAVDRGVAISREVAEFCNLVKDIRLSSESTMGTGGIGDCSDDGGRAVNGGIRSRLFDPAFLLILHSLEAFALGGDERSFSKEARRCLQLLGRKADPASAKETLVEVGLWSVQDGINHQVRNRRDRSDSTTTGRFPEPLLQPEALAMQDKGGRGDGGMGRAVPWPMDVLEAGARLGEERCKRGKLYAKRPPTKTMGAPAPFGR